MKVEWTTVATVALTATTTILASIGMISGDESTSLATTGAGAITGVVAFATAIVECIKAHRKAGGE